MSSSSHHGAAYRRAARADAPAPGMSPTLFLLLTGLADGLAPKERRYATRAIRPNNLGPPLPPPGLVRAARDFSYRGSILTIPTDGRVLTRSTNSAQGAALSLLGPPRRGL